MPKLHELLAVSGNLKAQADKTRGELMSTFKNKTERFMERTVSYKPYEEGAPTVVESQLDIQTTVPEELRWVSGFLIGAINSAYLVAEANTEARADVVLDDGSVMITSLPATALLELEKRMNELHAFILTIPTLDPAKGFRPDPDKGKFVFRAREDRKTRTKKMNKVLTLAPATDKHAAQVQVVTEDVPVGEIYTIEWSGLLTVSVKGDMLSRVEELKRAVKKARSRANDVEIGKDKQSIGAALVNYVFGI
jgi:hypothetical protein